MAVDPSETGEAVVPETRTRIAELTQEHLDWHFKGFPPADITIGEIGAQRWSALTGDLPLPVMILKEPALEHNLNLMARFCRESGVDLAPHGKTTMAPQIIARQLERGAWGVTVGTVSQAMALHHFGIRRILVANEIVDPAGLRWIARTLVAEPRLELLCLVDSLEGVTLAGDVLPHPMPGGRLGVLVELGYAGGRAGCRSIEQAIDVARAVTASHALKLLGVEGFEGLMSSGSDDEPPSSVDDYLHRIRELTTLLDRAGMFAGTNEIIVTAGGSCHFDRVVDILAQPWSLTRPVRVVLRSGCYAIHDHGTWARCSPFGSRVGGTSLLPALELIAAVVSRPEPTIAILGFGRRDVPVDAGLPVPLHAWRSGEEGKLPSGSVLLGLNDQHAYARISPDYDLGVGDLVGLGISHPCGVFDRWSLLPLVDSMYRVTGAIRTLF